MGKSLTPKYVLEIRATVRDARGVVSFPRFTPMAWTVKEYGKANEANLLKWVKAFEASTKPGGANAHLGETTVNYAHIRLNRRLDHFGEAPVVAWRRPLFEII